MKFKVLILVFLYYVGNFLVLPYLFVIFGDILSISSFHISILKNIGIVMIILGLANSAYYYYIFFKNGAGTPMSIHPTQRLIVDGGFKYTRNPLYLGQFIILFGEFLWLGSWALLVYFIIFVIVYNFLIIPYEEVENEKRFGVLYTDYKKSTPRFF